MHVGHSQDGFRFIGQVYLSNCDTPSKSLSYAWCKTVNLIFSETVSKVVPLFQGHTASAEFQWQLMKQLCIGHITGRATSIQFRLWPEDEHGSELVEIFFASFGWLCALKLTVIIGERELSLSVMFTSCSHLMTTVVVSRWRLVKFKYSSWISLLEDAEDLYVL